MRTVTHTMLWAFLVVLCVMARPAVGQQNGAARNAGASGVQVDKSSVGGVVLNSNGAKPEAGVWVIAETKSLPVPFRKIVVTDDQGRFLVPDLPDGSYELWVRGYGLKDSERVPAARGAKVKLQVANAATPQEAAKIYPASYWTSMIHPPAKDQLPPNYASQEQWLAALRGGCNQCHQLGMTPTRRYTDPDDWDGIFQRNPALYANGKVYGADRTGGGRLWVLDPVKNTVEGLQVQPRNAKGLNAKVDYYHERESEEAWMASPHNPMFDEHGRVWMTEPVRPPGVADNQKWSGSTIAMEKNDQAARDLAAKALLSRNHGMQLGFYDPKANKF